MKSDHKLRCPVCRAAFRETAICSRCGADLTTLMNLAARAYSLRQNARRAISQGNFSEALNMADQAQNTCATSQGEQIRLLAAWCAAHTRSVTEEESPLAETSGLGDGFRHILNKITQKVWSEES